MVDRFDLSGKRALITGGGRGLGREMAQAFAEHGADVIIASRKLDVLEQTGDQGRKNLKALFKTVQDVALDPDEVAFGEASPIGPAIAIVTAGHLEFAGDASKAYEGDMGVATPDTRELMPPIRRQVEDVARRDHSLKNLEIVENVEVHVCTRAPRERVAVRKSSNRAARAG